MKKLFIITGEYSGDKHAAGVVKAIQNSGAEIEIEAVGGENLKSTGIKIFSDHKDMSAMGIGLNIIFKHINLGKKIVHHLKTEFRADLVLLIDYGGFNLNLSKVLKKEGFKVFYYIPPQIWASRKWRLNTVQKCIDKVITIFPFEEKMYKSKNIDVEYAGHPLLNQIPPKADKQRFFDEHGLDLDKELISIFPGSRVFEIKNLLKLFLKSAEIIRKKRPDVQFALCLAPTISDELINKERAKLDELNIKVIKNRNYELLSLSDALILASGTVALEAAIYATPMIISYRGPQLFYFIYLLVRCIDMVSLPNIISGEMIIPELVQNKAKPQIIAAEILKIVQNKEYRQNMINKLQRVKDSLTVGNSAENTARIIIKNI